ncbi:LIM domain-containing protein pin-2-like [Convolutriloba macropyga]|uniref:LIM domain-containing protein pin-2-like n=1 Tax=Convolutriloba macropyga TaxID=536237 RepID=UPI003F5200B3
MAPFRCAGCAKEVTYYDNKIKSGNKVYHYKCLLCASCHKPFRGQMYNVQGKKGHVCKTCYKTKYAKLCAYCNNLILEIVNYSTEELLTPEENLSTEILTEVGNCETKRISNLN